MATTVESILEQALALDATGRAEVAGILLESLEGQEADPNVEEAWRQEVRQRLREAEASEVELIPWDKVRRGMLARLNGHS